MNKHDKWWDSLDPKTREYLEKQPIWHDRDLVKAAIVGAVVGLIFGFLIGWDYAYKPAVQVFRPLIG